MRFIVLKPLMHLGVQYQIGSTINLEPEQAEKIRDCVAPAESPAPAVANPIVADAVVPAANVATIGEITGNSEVTGNGEGTALPEIPEVLNPEQDEPQATPSGDETPTTDKKSKK